MTPQEARRQFLWRTGVMALTFLFWCVMTAFTLHEKGVNNALKELTTQLMIAVGIVCLIIFLIHLRVMILYFRRTK